MKKHTISLRLTDEEISSLKAKVSKTNLSREAFIRNAIKNARVVERPPIEYGDILRELRRIGSNVDQILVKLRALGFADDRRISKALEDIRDMDEMFRGFFI